MRAIQRAGRAILLCLALLLPIAACQDDPPASGTGESAHSPGAPDKGEAPAEIPPAAKATATPVEAPLDLTLPPDPVREASPLPRDPDQPLLPELFEQDARKPNQVSGKLLFQEEGQEGALENISGAQLEVNIPVE